VFAGDQTTEGADRPNLNLPGDENALIAAVAAANPRTCRPQYRGAVLMPWLRHVAAVLEAWYRAKRPARPSRKYLAAASTPPVDCHHLPASENEMPETSARMFPGSTARRLWFEPRIGYRWYQATHVTPLFRLRLRTHYHELRSVRSADYASTSGVEVRCQPERGRSEW